MIYNLLSDNSKLYFAVCILGAFFITFLAINFGRRLLPKDQGRQFAVNGGLSEGKPRGAGLIFITTFVLCTALFVPLSVELIIYLGLIYLAMLTGYFDDAAEKPWSELKKGILDLFISVGISVTYYYFNGSTIRLLGSSYTLPAWMFIALGVVLVWSSINVTNCSDGIDGLCGSVSIVTLLSALYLLMLLSDDFGFMVSIICLIMSLFAYLWFNASPSKLLMGDAGSRAIGVVIAAAMLKTNHPFMFIPLAFILIIDGGLGLVKLSFRRYLKLKNFMANTRTPIHDHMRKNKSWSDTQVVFRFIIIQVVISLAIIIAFPL